MELAEHIFTNSSQDICSLSLCIVRSNLLKGQNVKFLIVYFDKHSFSCFSSIFYKNGCQSYWCNIMTLSLNAEKIEFSGGWKNFDGITGLIFVIYYQ